MVDHELMQSLEYKGEYGCRYRCFQCSRYERASIGEKGRCTIQPHQDILVSYHNNICRCFDARIKNISAPIFNFEAYFEFLMSDYYRPYGIDTEIVVGYIDRPSFYTSDDRGRIPLYKQYDKPYCRIVRPLTVACIGKYHFELDYRLFMENMWCINNKVVFKKCYWKDKSTQRKYTVVYNGVYDVLSGEIISGATH